MRSSTARFGNDRLCQRTSGNLWGQAIDCAIGSSNNGGPICRVLQITPSTFYAHLAVERDPDLASDRMKRDAEVRRKMKQIWEDNQSVYGARKL